MDNTIEKEKERFCKLLLDTGRENMEYVIEDLEALGFFKAPASVRNVWIRCSLLESIT